MWCRRYLERGVAESDVEQNLHWGLGMAAVEIGDVATAARELEIALTWIEARVATDPGDEYLRGQLEVARAHLAVLFMRQGQVAEGMEIFEAILADLPPDASPSSRVLAELNVGAAAAQAREWVRAREVLRSVREQAEALDLPGVHAKATVNLALVETELGNPAVAVELLEPVLAERRRDGNVAGIAMALVNLASAALAANDLVRAGPWASESVRLAFEFNSDTIMAAGLHTCGEVAARRGDAVAAARLLGAIDATSERAGAPAVSDEELQALADRIAGLLEPAAAEEARADGRDLDPAAAVALAEATMDRLT
jgi:tetratricopeptide (TPR) repeat protein